MNLNLDIGPTEDGQVDAKLDFGELEAGTSYKFVLRMTNISGFDFVKITSTARPAMLKITDTPREIGAGQTGTVNLELDIPADILEAVQPDLAFNGVFLLR